MAVVRLINMVMSTIRVRMGHPVLSVGHKKIYFFPVGFRRSRIDDGTLQITYRPSETVRLDSKTTKLRRYLGRKSHEHQKQQIIFYTLFIVWGFDTFYFEKNIYFVIYNAYIFQF